MTGMPSSPLSSTPSDMTRPLAMKISIPWARDGSLPPFSNGGRCGRNFFPSCPQCGKKNNIVNKCRKQFDKPLNALVVINPLATFSPSSSSIPTPHYRVTLTSSEYDALHRSGSTDASSSASLASLLAPSMACTSGLLISFSSLWIINSGTSSQMTETSSLLSSYHCTSSWSPVTITDGRLYPV